MALKLTYIHFRLVWVLGVAMQCDCATQGDTGLVVTGVVTGSSHVM